MMISRSQIAGNATLASFNNPFYSPKSPLNSGVWTLDASFPVAQLDVDGDFQSNMPFQVPHRLSGFSSISSTGLGIFYPSTGQTENKEEPGDSKLGSGSDVAYCYPPESTYDTDFPMGILGEPAPDPFTLSSFLITTDLLRDGLDLMSDEPVVETRQESLSLLAPQEPSAPAASNEQGRWVLQRILEMSGHTVESLSAELKTRLGGDGWSSTSSHVPEPVLQSNAACFQNSFLRHPRNSPVLGINPAAIMPLQPQLGLLPLPETPTLEPEVEEDLGVENSPNLTRDTIFLNGPELPGSPVPLTTQLLKDLEENNHPYKRESDYEPSISPQSEFSSESAFIPKFSRHKVRIRSTRVPRRRAIQRVPVTPYVVPSESMTDSPVVRTMPIDYGTPVLDAHRGVELCELKAKAERYRNRNQGSEYDKKWLLSFAGKLTPQGLMTEEYRCYIVGCNQSNRRRDHILIHVGGHLDQRPFACSHCPARFLRKNECKRHELSHSGTRPFTCDICPFGTTAFVRQDLLKRHQKRTHNLDNTRGRTTKRHHQH